MARKYIVGIDLGTTNTAVAWAELSEPPSRVKVLEVAQLVAPGEVGTRTQVPSFVYLAGELDLPATATALPWGADGAVDDARGVVGELARAQGARVPGRMISSSKSWLSHERVDRQARILPWGAAEDAPRLSPVDAGTAILRHVVGAWGHAMGGARLEDQDVVLTVPASFDEVARELTAAAAERAGLRHVTLVEEPQAVFYAWIDAQDARRRREALRPGEHVLVCDVGGGTTDFTIIRVAEDGDHFERTAVGDHLLLGGDNVDIALARIVEGRLQPAKLDAVQWQGLVHACRLAKEQLLADPTLTSRAITVAARGSKLIGGALKSELSRAEVETLVLDGFFPRVDREARPARARAGLQEFGLPYAADAAITRHLAAFWARHGSPRLDAVLFNGGAMKPEAVRARVLDQIGAWQEGARPRELANAAPELAVAKGAAYYGLVRHGFGAKIRGGAARAYYVGVEGGGAVCVAPRGAEEGSEFELGQDLVAVLNRPVSFRLYSASARNDVPGASVAQAADELHELPPVVTVLRLPGRAEARVRLVARLTELGTLELWCHAVGGGPEAAQKFRLTFDLRGGAPQAQTETADERIEPAKTILAASFRGDPGATAPAQLMKELERVLEARRDEWSTATCRALWDALHTVEDTRGRSADVEARWLNLAGFLLRPGHGAPLDDWRSRETWRLWNVGIKHEKDEACRLSWWILWRRIGAGLKRGQQEQIFDRIAPLFLPGPQQKAKWFKARPSTQEATEMWRTLASLERLTPSAKAKLGDALIEKLEQARTDKKALSGVGGCDAPVAFWAVGRLGARAPLAGPVDAVVSPDVAARWIARLSVLPWDPPERVAFSVAQLGRRTGDRARDLDAATRDALAERLRAVPGAERTARLVEEIVELEAPEERVAFGDSLPTGFKLGVTEP